MEIIVCFSYQLKNIMPNNNQCNDRLRYLRVKKTDSDDERIARVLSSNSFLDKALNRLGFLGRLGKD